MWRLEVPTPGYETLGFPIQIWRKLTPTVFCRLTLVYQYYCSNFDEKMGYFEVKDGDKR